MTKDSVIWTFVLMWGVSLSATAQERGRVPSTVEGVGVEVVGPNRITKNVPAGYKIILSNRRDAAVGDLVVEVELSETFAVVKTEPPGEAIPGRIAWQVTNLAGKENQTLSFQAIAQAGGSGRVRAFVRQAPMAEDKAKGISDIDPPDLPPAGNAPATPPPPEPGDVPSALATDGDPAPLPPSEPKGGAKIEINVPERVAAGVPFVCELTLTNVGKVALSTKRFEMTPTKGLRVVRNLDSSGPPKMPSEPGDSTKVRIEMVAEGGGIQAVRAKLTAEPGVAEQVEREITVDTAPFDLKMEMADDHVMGQPLKFRLFIANNRNEPATGVQVFVTIPDGVEVVSGEAGALFNRRTRTVRWQAGTLEPQEERGFRLTVKPTLAGVVRFDARAEGGAGSLKDELTSQVRVSGFAALGVNFEPDVDVATEFQDVTLTFDVRSRGTQAAEGVVFQVEVPEGVELVEARSPGWKEEAGWWKKDAAGAIPPGGQMKELLVIRPRQSGAISLKGIVTGSGDVGEIVRVQPLRVSPAPPPTANPPNGT
jgi:hypothetical protein